MKRVFYLSFFVSFFGIVSYANQINYGNCNSIQEAIAKETEEIGLTRESDHDELAQLYVSRGESYLLNGQYVEAIEDFQQSSSYIPFCQDMEEILIVAFRVAFGEAVAYDNLGLSDQTNQALENLKMIVMHVGCDDCKDYQPCHRDPISFSNKFHSAGLVHFSDIVQICKHKKDKNTNHPPDNSGAYDDILGPNEPPVPYWCEEVVTGVGRSMDAIACLAPNYLVKITLIGIIEALISRGVKCCQAGGFWKACVAPITRKWVEWKNNKERSVLPNEQNLPKYIH